VDSKAVKKTIHWATLSHTKMTGFLGLCPLSGILKTREDSWKPDLFPSSDEREDTHSVGFLRKS
jgi:hypothetical protein